MKNKKGFTLIELLAIISILAIILLIAVPAISNVIETSRKNAFKDTALSVIKAAEFSYDLKKLENNVIEEITIDLGDKNDPNRGLIELKGEYPSGTVVIKDTGVVVVNITNGYFCATGTRDDLEIKKGDCEEDFPIVVSNADDECFTVVGNTIVGYKQVENYECPTDLIIPNYLNGSKITSITSVGGNLSSLTIPEGITRIEGNAFIPGNIPVYLPTSLEYIGDYNLSMQRPSNVISENGFKYLSNKDGTTNKNIILGYNGKKTDIKIPKETKIIISDAFTMIYPQLLSVDFSEATSLKQIGPKAFANNLLTNVEIPNSVIYLSQSAFNGNQLNGLDIPSTIKAFTSFYRNDSDQVFRNDNNMQYKDETTGFVYLKKTDGNPDKRFLISYDGESKNIEIDESVTQILPNTFEWKELESIKLPDGLISIDANAFSQAGLNTITIPNSVTYIGYMAFSYNHLTNLIIPNSVTYIGSHAFYQTSLESVSLGDSVKIIEENAFNSNELNTITIPNSVTYIGDSAFRFNNIDVVIIKGDCGRFDSFSNNSLFGENSSITCESKK